MPIKQPDYQLKLTLDLPDEPLVGQVLSVEDVRLRFEVARRLLEGGDIWPRVDGKTVKPAWFEQYLLLLAGGWDWKVAVLIAWMAQPKAYRWPKTQEELATKVLGLTNDRQISTWRAKNRAIDAMARDVAAASVLDALVDSFAAMNTVAAIPNYKSRGDRELQFKLAGLLSDGGELKVTDGNLDEVLKQMPFADILRGAGIDTADKLLAWREKWAKDLAAEKLSTELPAVVEVSQPNVEEASQVKDDAE